MIDRVYMNKVVGGGTPVAVHTSMEGAVARAAALARESKRPVHVLATVAVVTPLLPVTAEIEVMVEVVL